MTEIARGEIYVEVEDRGALAALRRIDNEFDRTMDRIDREEAEVTLGADLDRLKRDLKEADARIAAWDKKYREATTKGQERYRAEMLKTAKLERDRLANALAGAEKEASAIRNKNKELDLTAKRITAIEKREAARARVEERIEERRLRRIRQHARSVAALNKQREAEMARSERAAHAEDRARQKSLDQIRREQNEIPKLQRRYVELVDKVEKLAAARRKASRAGDQRGTLLVDVKTQDALREISMLQEELERRGGPIDLPVDLHPGRNFGLMLRQQVEAGFRDGRLRGAVRGAGIGLGVVAGASIADGIRRTFTPRAGVALLGRGLSRVGQVFENLSQMTVRLGPFTATIRQLMLAMSVLGPMILDLVGGLGALISVTGSATLGLGALSVGFLGGAIPAALGFFAVLKPLTEQFGAAMKASDALAQAELKHGKGSEQAAKKAKELRQVLKGVDEETVKNFQSAGNLAGRWEKLTAPSRASAFNVIGKGLKFASDNMGIFAARTNVGFAIAEKGINRWIKGLDSAEGRDILGKMMDNFNESLGPILNGLGNIGTYLGRVGAIASGYLPGIFRGFEQWSKGLADGAANSDRLSQKIRTVVESLRSVGNFAMSSGRFLKSFFGAGVGGGQRFLNTMTNALNRWTVFANTVEGRQQIADFFDRAVTGVQSLYSALAPLISTFVRWAGLISPLASAFFRGAGAIGSFVNQLLKVTALRGTVTALVSTLGALWAVNKVSAATTAVINFTRALLGLKTAQAGLVAVQGGAALTGLGTAAAGAAPMVSRLGSTATSTATGTAALTAGSAAAGTKVGALRAAATRVVPAIGGMGAMAGGAATLGVTALGAAAVFGAYKLVTLKSEGEKAQEQFTALSKSVAGQAAATKQVGMGLGDLGGQYANTRMQVKLARQELDKTKKGTDEHAVALMNYRDAIRMNTQARLNWTKSSESYLKAERKTNDALKEQKDLLPKIRRQQEKQRAIGLDKAAEQKLEKLKDRYRELGEAAERSRNRMAAAGLNVERAYRGLPAVLGKAQQQLGALARMAPQLGKKIALKFEDPKDAGRVAAKAKQALQSGVPKKITSRIVGDSKSAEEAVRRLQRAKITPKKLTILEQGGAKAIRVVEQLIGRKLTPKEQRIAQKGGEGVMRMLERILGKKLPQKVQKIAESGASRVVGAIQNIARQIIPPKVARISQTGGSSVLGIMNAINGAAGTVTKTINIVTKRVGKADGGVMAAQGFAAVGMTPDERRQLRAADEAARRAVVDVRSGGRRITRPTTVVGEENRPEFIIATNPRYRRRNLGILRAAARSLGTDVEGEGPLFAAQGYFAPTKLPDAPPPVKGGGKRPKSRKKRKRRQRRVYRSNNQWMAYVANLTTQQDDWEREASIRESQVTEPEDFIKDTGKKTPSGDPIYVLDTRAINVFKGQLEFVRQAYARLMAITVRLLTAIPQAIKSANVEIGVRKENIKKLNDSIGRSKKQKAATKSETGKTRIQRRIDRDDRRREREREAINVLREDKANLTGQHKEAGFDFREFQIQHNAQVSEIKAVDPQAKQQLAESKGLGGGGGGGGGETPVALAIQGGLVDTERMNVLREFGSNFKPIGPTTTPKAMGALVAAATAGPLTAAGGAIAQGAAIGSQAATRNVVASAFTGGNRAAQEAAAPGGGGGGAVAPGGGETNIQVINNYQTQPEDPHTWSKGLEFELGALG